MTGAPPPDTAQPTRPHRTRDVAARIWKSRISRLASIWLVVAVVEYLAWRFFLRSSFYREFFEPIVIVVLLAGIAASWRALGRRESDRREGDRRRRNRRDRA